MTASTAGAQRIREFKMPDVGEGLTEAEILKWYVQPGDTVTDGQVVCEVETAKAAVELPIPYDGVVHALHFDEGVTVDVGTAIIAVDTDPGAGPAETPAAPAVDATAAASTKRRARKPQPGAPAGVPAQPASVNAGLQTELNGRPAAAPVAAAPVASVAPAVAAGRPLAKPPVRKLAKDLGIDLATIT